jgi:acetolactate synthase-1/2/3 large subunit
MIDPDAGVYPMVGPGATYAQMITGEFIASRAAPARAGEETTDMF